MSVLACDRVGCENIMCDRLSDNFGYICHECFQELKESGCKTVRDVKDFMNTKPSDSFRKVDLNEEFKNMKDI